MKVLSAFIVAVIIACVAATMMSAGVSARLLNTNSNKKPAVTPVDIRSISSYSVLSRASSGSGSTLYQINVAPATNSTNSNTTQQQTVIQPDYSVPPLLLTLKGNRTQIGYDYADLLAEQSSQSYIAFLNKTLGTDPKTLNTLYTFLDWLWDDFYSKNTPKTFLDELEGMKNWATANPSRASALEISPYNVSRRFYALANMPADPVNIISGLENTLEKGWPQWLKDIINDIIKILEKMGHHCDAFGIFGSRTAIPGKLFASRNLDFAKDTGIDKYKLIISYDINDGTSRHKYVSIGFSVGLGALAGMNDAGITTSEMNLDNSRTDFRGVPFPLRLRMINEGCSNLQQCMSIWNSTTNTNSFNFFISSANDKQAYALETMWQYTAQFPANSPVEAAATYDCGYPPNYDPTCQKWVWNPQNKYGKVQIGFPLPDAVWRTNHGLNPEIMATQEPLFNGTVYRYRLAHDIILGYENAGAKFADLDAVNLVASMGTKGGSDFLTCDTDFNQDFKRGDNIMSIVYSPTVKEMYVAWERGGALSGGQWRPAACSPYIHVDLNAVWKL